MSAPEGGGGWLPKIAIASSTRPTVIGRVKTAPGTVAPRAPPSPFHAAPSTARVIPLTHACHSLTHVRHSLTPTRHSLTPTRHSLTRACHSLTRICHSLTCTCHSLTRTRTSLAHMRRRVRGTAEGETDLLDDEPVEARYFERSSRRGADGAGELRRGVLL